MLQSFISYFFKYILFSKTRQRLLLLAVVGLFISSFALIVLQSSMAGLQNNLIARSKAVEGYGSIEIKGSPEISEKIISYLDSQKVLAHRELQLELLMRQGNYLAPVIVHGIHPDDPLPGFLKGMSFDDIVTSLDLAVKINSFTGSNVQLVSPAHSYAFFGNVPKYRTGTVEGSIDTGVPEGEVFNAWTRMTFLQSLIRKKDINRVIIHTPFDAKKVSKFLEDNFKGQTRLVTWEQKYDALVWSLNLETTVMTFLFIGMSFLVALCVISGLLIFLDKVKLDFGSFWILGASKKGIERASQIFLISLSFLSSISGLLFGLFFLLLLDQFGGEILPDIFVDRKVPVKITAKGVLISFSIPFFISFIFSMMTLKQFKKENNYLEHVRALGR